MRKELLEDAVALLEKTNADLEPELVTHQLARELLEIYARVVKLGTFGVAALSRKLDDPTELARMTGTSAGKAKAVVATGRVLNQSEELSTALRHGDISLDQATEIAATEEACPGAASELLQVAQTESFHVLKDKARKLKLEAEQHGDLFARQRAARSASSHKDALGMINIYLCLQPHIGTPVVTRAEAEAARLARKAKSDGITEPFECHLADAYAKLLSGSGKGRSKRPELVVLVSHEVAKRGWTDVRRGEVCKIPGIGPVSPQVAKTIAEDAFLSGVFFDGTDLRHLRRWSRNIPVEVMLALELGPPPSFDGVACVDCGNRFRNEFDHVLPKGAGGPTSNPNLRPRCWRCHQAKPNEIGRPAD
jgi:5-methylcytosine-specific restriction endonuclease McrA